MAGERNLAPERGPNVWEREEWAAPGSRNRWLQGLGGAAIAVTGAALAAVGGSMIYRAARNAEPVGTTAGVEGEALPQQAETLEDVVSQESKQSFPASDVPSWTPTIGAAPDRTKG